MSETYYNNLSNNYSVNDIIKFNDNNIFIYFRYFEKKDDYTDLLTYLMTGMNKYKNIQESQNRNHFVKVIADFDGIKLAKLDFDFLKELLNYLDVNYDKLLSEFYCVNVTVVFKMGYKIIKPLLNKSVKSKIKFLKKGENSKLIEINENELDNI